MSRIALCYIGNPLISLGGKFLKKRVEGVFNYFFYWSTINKPCKDLLEPLVNI
jgi:hypothetical protein